MLKGTLRKAKTPPVLLIHSNNSKMNSDSYFVYLQQALISYNFLKGTSPDYTLEVTLEDFKELHDPTDLKNNLGERTLQSAIVETVSSLVTEKDEQVQI